MCCFFTSSLSFLFSWLPPRQIQRSDAFSRNSGETSQHMQLMTWCSHGELSVNSLQTVWSDVLHEMSTHFCLFRIIRHIYAKYFKEALVKKKCKKASECLIDTVQASSQSVSRTFRRVRCVILMASALRLRSHRRWQSCEQTQSCKWLFLPRQQLSDVLCQLDSLC